MTVWQQSVTLSTTCVSSCCDSSSPLEAHVLRIFNTYFILFWYLSLRSTQHVWCLQRKFGAKFLVQVNLISMSNLYNSMWNYVTRHRYVSWLGLLRKLTRRNPYVWISNETNAIASTVNLDMRYVIKHAQHIYVYRNDSLGMQLCAHHDLWQGMSDKKAAAPASGPVPKVVTSSAQCNLSVDSFQASVANGP